MRHLALFGLGVLLIFFPVACVAHGAPLPEVLKVMLCPSHKKSEKKACCECKCTKAGIKCKCGKGEGCRCVIAAEGTPYDHLPTSERCRQNYYDAREWRKGIVKEAIELGWLFDQTNNDLWEGNRLIWVGGGWPARAMQEEIEETKALERVWWLAWSLRCPRQDESEHPELEAELRGLIGDRAYVTGHLPPPVPTWRVQRRYHIPH